ncbi:MAG: hypothetical protein HY782_17345 [Chloroflexi bacterium]|nr:hypothetical protein [Chloroflexota bacterium]
MCLNCGCGDYDDRRGEDANITMADVEQAAEANGMSVLDTVQEMIGSLQVQLKELQKKK